MRYMMTRIMGWCDGIKLTLLPRTRLAPSPLGGGGWRGGSLLLPETRPPTPTPTSYPSPQGGGEQTEFAARMRACASIAECRVRGGGEAAARGERGGRRLRALDPGVGSRARLRRKLRQLGERAGNIAARDFRLAAGKDRGAVVPGRLIDAADADELFRIRLQLAEHTLARRSGSLQRRRKCRKLARERAGRGHTGRRKRLEHGNELRIGTERLDGGEIARKQLAAVDRGVERIRRQRTPHPPIAPFPGLLAPLYRRYSIS